MKYTQYLDMMENKLKGSFDTERDYIINNLSFDLYAAYRIRNERYILTKKATVYAIECYEYSFIKYYEELNTGNLEICLEALVKSIDEVVKPNNDHMSSIITGVLVTDKTPGKDITEAVSKFKYHRGFAFGFKGWADIRVILVTLNEGLIITNKKGKEVSKVYGIYQN